MKTYIVKVSYTGEEVYLLSAQDEKDAELRALEFFKNSENSNALSFVKDAEIFKNEIPTGAEVVEVSDLVHLEPAEKKEEK